MENVNVFILILWRRHNALPYHEQPLEGHLQLQWCQVAEGGSFAAAAAGGNQVAAEGNLAAAEGGHIAAEGGHIAAGGSFGNRQVAAMGSSAAVAGGS